MTDHIRTRFLVIGTGVAGLHTAWRAAQGVTGDGDVLLLTKRSLFDSSTAYAQGGIAAALGAGDSPALHRADTLAAGAALCDADAVQVLVEEGPSRVRELQTAGAAFDLTPTGEIKLGREAAHSRDRIVHARGDQTGAEVARTLVARVRAERRIQVLEHARVLDLVVDDGPRGRRCVGARASVSGRPVEITADATVLATGGCGQVYRYTTNPLVATGDGYAIAHRAGATLADMEFVQFHPTALDTAENPLALVSEAVRGEGALLLNAQLERFMPARHPQAELAPRDVVAREIFREQQRTGKVWLDARRLGGTPGSAPGSGTAGGGRVRFSERFPGIYALCTARGIDPERALIPVTPAAHYMMGGVVTDLAGRASLDGLWAVGEVARTGVHGANRLASNSLLEGLVFAERAARDLLVAPRPVRGPRRREGWEVPPLSDRGAAQVAAGAVRTAMWEGAAIDRTGKGLERCLARLRTIEARLAPGMTEERNLVDTARMIAEAALRRRESRGGHYRSDFPVASAVAVSR